MNAQAQVGPGEPGDEFPRVLQGELREDVAPDLGRRRGRERRHLWAAEFFEHLAEPEIIRPEIMAPLRDAVRLVDGKQRNGHTP